MLTKLLDWITRTLRERRTHEELGRLDERTLRDIGIDSYNLGRRHRYLD